MSVTATEYVLALATLGVATRNRNNPICVVPTKVAKARTMVSVTSRCHLCYSDKLCQYKYNLSNQFLSFNIYGWLSLNSMSVVRSHILLLAFPVSQP